LYEKNAEYPNPAILRKELLGKSVKLLDRVHILQEINKHFQVSAARLSDAIRKVPSKVRTIFARSRDES
jgi:hypothetical protein